VIEIDMGEFRLDLHVSGFKAERRLRLRTGSATSTIAVATKDVAFFILEENFRAYVHKRNKVSRRYHQGISVISTSMDWNIHKRAIQYWGSIQLPLAE
jgi:hypothetical protein